jgi:hypothetical protein
MASSTWILLLILSMVTSGLPQLQSLSQDIRSVLMYTVCRVQCEAGLRVNFSPQIQDGSQTACRQNAASKLMSTLNFDLLANKARFLNVHSKYFYKLYCILPPSRCFVVYCHESYDVINLWDFKITVTGRSCWTRRISPWWRPRRIWARSTLSSRHHHIGQQVKGTVLRDFLPSVLFTSYFLLWSQVIIPRYFRIWFQFC